jgi:hypothetical protein
MHRLSIESHRAAGTQHRQGKRPNAVTEQGGKGRHVRREDTPEWQDIARGAEEGCHLQFLPGAASMCFMKRRTPSSSPMARRFQHFLIRLIQHARDDLQHLPLESDRRIHDLRIRMKKLGAILRLVKARMPEREYRTILDGARKIKHAFNRQRDARVAAELSGRLGVQSPRKKKPPLRPVAPLFIEVAILERLLKQSAFTGLRDKDVLAAYVKSYHTGRKRWKTCRKDPEPDLLHSWRRSVKKFFYQSLALRELKGAKHRIERARNLGKWLGHDHDWYLMAQQAEKGGEPKAARLLEKRRKCRQQKIFKLAEKLYGKSPRDLKRKLKKHLA